jgi:hypothetical protein
LAIGKEMLVGAFSGLFGEKQDPLQEKAATLVQAARASAVGMFVPLLDRFPALREADPDHWDFVLTIAGTFMAATRLNNLGIGDAREEKLMEIVAVQLSEWKPDGIRGFEDCKGFFESEFDRLSAAGHPVRFVASDAVGKWIVWNVLGRPPETEEECTLVRTTGTMVTHSVFDWWE